MRCLAVLPAAMLAATTIQAQVVSSGFERDVNRYRWTSNAFVDAAAGGWELAMANRFVSDAYVQYDNRLRFRDENILRLTVRRPFTRVLSAEVRGRMDWYGLSRAFTQGLYAGVRAALSPSAFVEPTIGIAADRRPGVLQDDGTLPQRLDTGPAFGARMGARRTGGPGYQLTLEGEALWQQITPRRGRSLQFAGGAARDFGSATLTTAVRVASRRRDTYQSASFLNRNVARSETIEATVSDTLDASIEFLAPVYRGLRLRAQAELRANRRQIRTHRAPEETLFFDTDFDRRALDASVGLVYDAPNLAAQLLVESTAASEQRRLTNGATLPPSEATQKSNLLLQADFDEGIVGIRGSLRGTLLPRLAVLLTGSSRIVRHDTPEANPDDRDEVYHQAELGLQWLLSRYVQADVRLFGSWFHAVYLRSERSAENNVQRSLRLRPTVRWNPTEHTRVRIASEVRANYTVDDFVLPGRRPTDQSAREMRMEAALDQRVWMDTDLRASVSYADLRLGRLLWDSFAEIPFDTLRTYNAWLRMETGRRLRTTIGWRLYLRSDYDRAATVQYERVGTDGTVIRDDKGQVLTSRITRPGRRWIQQIGPTAAVSWQRGPSEFRLDAWANIQRVYHRLYGDLPEVSAPRIRAAARAGTRRFIPMMTLTVVWNL